MDERKSIVGLSCAMPDYTKITISCWFPSRQSSVRPRKKRHTAKIKGNANINKHRSKANEILTVNNLSFGIFFPLFIAIKHIKMENC